MSTWDFPEDLSQGILAGIILVWRTARALGDPPDTLPGSGACSNLVAISGVTKFRKQYPRFASRPEPCERVTAQNHRSGAYYRGHTVIIFNTFNLDVLNVHTC